jgi:hypothetical protein
MPARAMTPVRITVWRPALPSGRMEAWAAASIDGIWTYTRIEDDGTPWSVEHIPSAADCGLFGTISKARRATFDGSALAGAKL